MSTIEPENNNLFVDFLDDYLAESEEHLAVIRHNLLTLETFVDQPSIERSLVDELFRSFHTIKGLSGMVGLKEAEQLAHQMESYLRELRDNQIVLTVKGMDALIDGTKMLEQTIANYGTHNPLPDISPAIAKLTSIFSDDPSPTENETGAEEIVAQQANTTTDNAAPIPPSVPPVFSPLPPLKFKPEESTRINAAIASGTQVWCFSFVPDSALAQRGINVNHVRQRLQSIGELIHSAPRMTTNGGVVFDFVVAIQTEASTFASWSDDGISFTPYVEEAEEQGRQRVAGVPPVVATAVSRGAEEQRSRGRRFYSPLPTPHSPITFCPCDCIIKLCARRLITTG